ncbi:tRNA pseudouridine32 synthase/23S rRNA pseudouridine746 synthase [Oceanisphaera litoralis]|uniref:TIGR01621 family pseudouridine synthase n=1 Tax=Oceanisphaera litoralis TaxID=225144 RepID=UPI00195CF7EF|nr:TIGR01621 family pseudouridine synthase [Oceanisphaera litoralis]MBM7455615.1 tRNA pseudouridine32 synthase/23S rRNA pseudouridine746 synthase [Oceanisphaera litoralis]
MDILLEHRDYLVINKAAGIGMHQEGDQPGLVRQLSETLGEPLYPVHRLDKITTGVLLLARNPDANRELSRQFAERSTRKWYLALSDHKPTKKQGLIKGDMEKARGGSWKLCRSLHNPAITRFHSTLLVEGLRAFLLQPQTGKTHQLRVALKSQGCAILGDSRYGGSVADRGYLHAWQLSFSYRGERVTVRAPLTEGEHFIGHTAELESWASEIMAAIKIN